MTRSATGSTVPQAGFDLMAHFVTVQRHALLKSTAISPLYVHGSAERIRSTAPDPGRAEGVKPAGGLRVLLARQSSGLHP